MCILCFHMFNLNITGIQYHHFISYSYVINVPKVRDENGPTKVETIFQNYSNLGYLNCSLEKIQMTKNFIILSQITS